MIAIAVSYDGSKRKRKPDAAPAPPDAGNSDGTMLHTSSGCIRPQIIFWGVHEVQAASATEVLP